MQPQKMQSQKCEIRIITHACATINDGNANLIFDPWFFGTAFNNGWKLSNNVDISRLSLGAITHACITHEHPDHFHIPTLKYINDIWNPIFLIQATSDRRMANFINRVLKKDVIELKDGESLNLSPSMSIEIYNHGHMDSFALIKANNSSILNINDCVLKTENSLRRIKKRLSDKSIDVLMSQYSFASYSGNAENAAEIKRMAEKHLEWIKQRNDFFQPKLFLPFASGIEWCANENKYLNDYSVKADDVENILMTCKTPPLILKPHSNKTITIENMLLISEDLSLNVNSEQNLAKENFCPNPDELELLAQIDTIVSSARTKLDRQNLMINSQLMKFLGMIHLLQKVLVEVDLKSNHKVYFELLPGLRLYRLKGADKNNTNKHKNHISMSIESLSYCFSNQFGAETLWVNSRFKVLKGRPKSFFKHFYTSILANQGFFFPFGYIRFTWGRILKPRLPW